ncbi:MipA/OmpV family protein [Halotalea alkalilenta]|uniref:MipA/OmpV family protein n=1 Tax=Halotalea alkalilenta TaxID=376489 RepID=UPI00048134F4|nr:MipA/OmpV family protein [Halotalea alkalilenta]
MTLFTRSKRWSMLLPAFAFVLVDAAYAQQTRSDTPDAGGSGFTFLSDAPNVTHWGLGVGARYRDSAYRGYGSDVDALPLFYFDNKWVNFFGTRADLKIGTWNDFSVALRGRYSFGGGYEASDSRYREGMDERDGGAWFGPAFSWKKSFGELSGSYLIGGNKGHRAELEFSREFQRGRFSISPYIGTGWSNSDYVDYYYGVRPSEVRTDRPAYDGESAFDVTLGATFDYRMSDRQTIILDLGVTRFVGGGVYDSPLVENRTIPEVQIGYVYRFQ